MEELQKTPESSPALLVQSHHYPPSWEKRVPKRIRAMKIVWSEVPFDQRHVDGGAEYDCYVNSHGAVSAILKDGGLLGLKPYEFKVVEWHGVDPIDVYNAACRDLPVGYSITVSLERHSGGVDLMSDCGDPIDFGCEDLTIKQQIARATMVAMKHKNGESW